MICLIAGNRDEALTYASGQQLEDNEWFFPEHESDLLFKSNFHVLVVGTAGWNVHPHFFEKIYKLAKERGRIGRK
jgi:hypothetical protein